MLQIFCPLWKRLKSSSWSLPFNTPASNAPRQLRGTLYRFNIYLFTHFYTLIRAMNIQRHCQRCWRKLKWTNEMDSKRAWWRFSQIVAFKDCHVQYTMSTHHQHVFCNHLRAHLHRIIVFLAINYFIVMSIR